MFSGESKYLCGFITWVHNTSKLPATSFLIYIELRADTENVFMHNS